VTLPERRYDLAGDVLAAAMDQAMQHETPIQEAVHDAAHQRGRRIASESRASQRRSQGLQDLGDGDLEIAAEVLADHGYEPRVDAQEICLANCPFDRLAAEHTELVCGMNLALIDGVLEGLEARRLAAELAPQEGFCCVKVRGG
jgi:predicted ArsR family transcriptional regulator